LNLSAETALQITIFRVFCTVVRRPFTTDCFSTKL